MIDACKTPPRRPPINLPAGEMDSDLPCPFGPVAPGQIGDGEQRAPVVGGSIMEAFAAFGVGRRKRNLVIGNPRRQ